MMRAEVGDETGGWLRSTAYQVFPTSSRSLSCVMVSLNVKSVVFRFPETLYQSTRWSPTAMVFVNTMSPAD